MVVTLESTVSVPEGVLFRNLAGEAILLHLENGTYYGLDEVGTRMWTLLTRYGQVALAYRELLDEYDVTAEQLRDDLLGLIDRLVAQELLEIDEA